VGGAIAEASRWIIAEKHIYPIMKPGSHSFCEFSQIRREESSLSNDLSLFLSFPFSVVESFFQAKIKMDVSGSPVVDLDGCEIMDKRIVEREVEYSNKRVVEKEIDYLVQQTANRAGVSDVICWLNAKWMIGENWKEVESRISPGTTPHPERNSRKKGKLVRVDGAKL